MFLRSKLVAYLLCLFTMAMCFTAGAMERSFSQALIGALAGLCGGLLWLAISWSIEERKEL